MNTKSWEISFGKPSLISVDNVSMSSKLNGDVLSNSLSAIVNFGPALVMVVTALILNQFLEGSMFLPCLYFQQTTEVDGQSQLPKKKLINIAATVLNASNVITVNRYHTYIFLKNSSIFKEFTDSYPENYECPERYFRATYLNPFDTSQLIRNQCGTKVSYMQDDKCSESRRVAKGVLQEWF